MAGCHTLLICAHPCQSVGGASLPEGSVRSVRSVGDIPVCFVGAVLALTGGKVELRLLDSGGSVGMAGCHTLLICAHPCQSVGGASLPEGSVRSVRSVGDIPVCFVGAVLALTGGKVELRLLDSGGSVGMAGCHTLLICAHPCQSVGGASLPEGSVRSVRSVGDIPVCFVGAVLALTGGKVELRLLDSGGSVGMAGCHTLLICAHPCQSVEGASLPEGSVCSVRSVGDIPACFVGVVLALAVGNVELRQLDSRGCVGMAGCHTLLHLCKSVLSVGATSLQETSVRSVGSVGI